MLSELGTRVDRFARRLFEADETAEALVAFLSNPDYRPPPLGAADLEDPLRVFKVGAFAGLLARLRVHSSAVASLAQMVARYTWVDPVQAFQLGLVHDVGIAAGLQVLGGQGHPLQLSANRWAAIEQVHAELGAHVLAIWQIPLEVRYHHAVDHGPMGAVMVLAELFAGKAGLGFEPALAPFDLAPHAPIESVGTRHWAAAIHALGFSGAQVDALKAEVAQVLPSLMKRR